MPKDKFKNAVEMKDLSKKGSANESVNSPNGQIITEAKLTAKEEAIEDTDELKKIIKKWKNHIAGTAKIKRKNGKFWSTKYAKAKIELLRDRIDELEEEEENDEEEDSSDSDSTSTADGSSSTENKNGNSSESTETTGGEKNVCAMININTEQINESTKEAESACEDEKAIETAGQATTAVVAPEAANTNSETSSEKDAEAKEEQPKKKGLIDKIGNAMKKGIQKVSGAVKGWWKKQGKIVKYLIIAILAVMSVFALWYLITAIIIPFAYGIFTTIAASSTNIIKIGMQFAGTAKTYEMTLKAGAKAWKTEEGWGAFFMLLCASIMATLPLISYWKTGVEALQQKALVKVAAMEAVNKAKAKAQSKKTGEVPESTKAEKKNANASGSGEDVSKGASEESPSETKEVKSTSTGESTDTVPTENKSLKGNFSSLSSQTEYLKENTEKLDKALANDRNFCNFPKL